MNTEIELAHAIDAWARMRARLLRLIREESVLLEEGLHALRRSPPQIEVMEDHVERVLHTFAKVRRELEEKFSRIS